VYKNIRISFIDFLNMEDNTGYGLKFSWIHLFYLIVGVLTGAGV
jgi:hypothetical protein